MNSNTKALLMAAGIMLLAVIFVGSGLYSITGNKPDVSGGFGVPQYASAECVATDERAVSTAFDMSQGEKLSSYTMKKEFFCNYNTPQCKMQIDINQNLGSLYVYYCPADAIVNSYSEGRAKCRSAYENAAGVQANQHMVLTPVFNENTDFWTSKEKAVVLALDVPFGGYVDSGDVTANVVANIYTLRSQTGEGFVTRNSGTCNVKDMHTNGKYVMDKDYIDAVNTGKLKDGILGFNKAINYISGLTISIDSMNVIKRNDVWVWVQSPGYVCPIEKTPSEFGSIKYFADCRALVSAPDIKCLPSTPGCKPDGTGYAETPNTGTCNWYGGGLPVGDYPKSDGTGEYCKWKCVDGKSTPFDCYKPTNCASGSTYDYQQRKCVESGNPFLPPPGTNQSDIPAWVWYALIALVVILIIALMIWAMKK